jgi:hypothetical protein
MLQASEPSIERHCREIERCNQRGGRMLSIVDLLDAGTVDLDAASYLLAAIGRGASFLVGARPGGAGKTTVMGALLNLLPPDVELVAADGLATIEAGLRSPSPRRCYICHEIGDGPYYAYLWGAALRRYFDLAEAGHLLATNLHADTYEEARGQVCKQNGVRAEAFRRVRVLLFLRVEETPRGRTRRIATCWESDGRSEHAPLIGAEGASLDRSALTDARSRAEARERLERIAASGARTIREVRRALLAPANPPLS